MHRSTPPGTQDHDPARDYNASYYAHNLGDEPCQPDSPVWHAFFGSVAEAIVGEIQPRTALDAGCGIGLLVEELRRRNVDARGLDFSPYAISQVPDQLRPYCTVGSILDPLQGQYDLVTCIEVVEHLQPELADAAISNLVDHTDTVLFSSTPDDFREPTHLNVQPTEYWAGLFARHGFYRDHSFDASVVSPHALLLRRRHGSMVATIRDYEAQRWRAAVEIRDLRAARVESAREVEHLKAQLERIVPASAGAEAQRAIPIDVDTQDPAWRLSIALSGARRRLAPGETRRGRAVRATLQGLADGLDWAYTRVPGLRGHAPPAAIDHYSSPLPRTGEPVVSNDDAAHDEPIVSHEQPESMPVVSEPVGGVDGPPPDSVWHRLVPVWGWAIDRASASGVGIQDIRVYLDGVFKGIPTCGLPRYDVEEAYGAPFLRAGWRMAVDLEGVPSGQHVVEVQVLSDVSGQASTLSRTVTVEPVSAPVSKKLVLFISDCPGDSFRYRCDHAAEQVRFMGGTADVAMREAIDLGSALEQYHLFVLHRVILCAEVEWFLEQARARQLPVIYDVDDFVFDVQAAPLLAAALERLTARQRATDIDGIACRRDALVRSGAAQVSTEPLRRLVNEALGRDGARVAPNAVSEAMVRRASAVQHDAATPEPATVTIAYLSGTPTHDRDFLNAADGLLWALETYPQAHLVTVGPVAVDDRFARFGDRVQQLPLRPWQELPAVLAAVDINIAPLEPNNPFTNAKSNIKYLEAALVGVPTIASPKPDFKRVITHGVNGFLAESPGQWRDGLGLLIESADLRRQVGQRARADVLRYHTTASTASAYCATLAEIVGRPEKDQRLIINWAIQVPDDAESHGSTAKVFELAHSLTRRGHRVRMCLVPEPPDRDPTLFPPADITIATNWATAELVAKQAASTFRAYFVQEHPTSVRASAASQSASLPLRYIGYGQDVAMALHEDTGRPAAHIQTGPDPEQAATELERMLLEMAFARMDQSAD